MKAEPNTPSPPVCQLKALFGQPGKQKKAPGLLGQGARQVTLVAGPATSVTDNR